MSIKQKAYNLINNAGPDKSKASKYFEIIIISLILLSIIEIILESFKSISIRYSNHFSIFETLTVIVFSTEYLLRIWTANLKYKSKSKINARLKFMFSFEGIIDLLAILPFYLPLIFKFDLRFIRILRVFRLIRIFKLNRHSKALNLLGTIFIEKKNEIVITLFINLILMLVSSTIMYNLENEVQPDKFPNIVDTFWWAIATLTTVGYGDVYPITAWGKVMSGIIATLGIGLVALPTGIISAGFVEKIEKKKEKSSSKYNYCPHCGEKIIHHEKH